MKLFALTLMKVPDESVQRLQESIAAAVWDSYKQNAVIDLKQDKICSVIEVNGVMPRFQLDKRMDALLQKVSEKVADWIISDKEEELLKALILKEFDYKQENDISSILSYYRQMLHMERTDESWEQRELVLHRKEKIRLSIYTFMQENTVLNIDGFMKFRLNEYREELREMAEYAIDEFLMDQQYREFISLLQYFVYIQEAKIPLAHLIHKGGNEFLLLNEEMEKIDTTGDTTLTIEMLEKDINFEDVIVSTLISVSPQLIYIHTRDPDVQIIQTIKQIFENRVEICEYCRLCQNLDRSAASDYNKG
ncbi:putative sporulation protein YtxC [Paenibacillus sp. LMG 31456]|uniref:Sporulation protein YtxC n=1 Tax=Paenibacillus foliorum TaxID=2654974 RepID=A0A972GQ38_9BACL|nr:putative sporulation protein YtxC [Paenibacillus foliorum]NOU92148.1 putative sporulation protein YtxC [Paenibacillus foliorum]